MGFNNFALAIFTIEVVLKVVAEAFNPMRYFESNWNKFDFTVVVASYLPGAGEIAMLLRMVRVLLVLKLVKQVPGLRMTVEGPVNLSAGIPRTADEVEAWIARLAR